MWFKWKNQATQLQQQYSELQTTSHQQLDYIQQLEAELARSQKTVQEYQQLLQFNRGLSGNLIRFGSSITQLGDSFEYLSEQMDRNKQGAQAVA